MYYFTTNFRLTSCPDGSDAHPKFGGHVPICRFRIDGDDFGYSTRRDFLLLAVQSNEILGPDAGIKQTMRPQFRPIALSLIEPSDPLPALVASAQP